MIETVRLDALRFRLDLAGPRQRGERAQQGQGMSDAELRMRMMLLQRSMGFGGIFRPAMDDSMRSPSAPSGGVTAITFGATSGASTST